MVRARLHEKILASVAQWMLCLVLAAWCGCKAVGGRDGPRRSSHWIRRMNIERSQNLLFCKSGEDSHSPLSALIHWQEHWLGWEKHSCFCFSGIYELGNKLAWRSLSCKFEWRPWFNCQIWLPFNPDANKELGSTFGWGAGKWSEL